MESITQLPTAGEDDEEVEFSPGLSIFDPVRGLRSICGC